MSGDEQVADELRAIAEETECCQRKMHLYIAADIVRQGRFEHPDMFPYSIRIDDLERENQELRSKIQRMYARQLVNPFR